jgi:hypothetical protein
MGLMSILAANDWDGCEVGVCARRRADPTHAMRLYEWGTRYLSGAGDLFVDL